MEGLSNFQNALEKTYSSLTVFSDLNWDDIFKEYLASHEERPTDVDSFRFNFPFYLQLKASEGDCPPWLFELAYFELAQSQVLEAGDVLPKAPGLHLNPTANFLNLEYDVGHMMSEAVKGSIQVVQRHHVLCLFKDPHSGLNHLEINAENLPILQQLEEGPLQRSDFPTNKILDQLIKSGLILENH